MIKKEILSNNQIEIKINILEKKIEQIQSENEIFKISNQTYKNKWNNIFPLFFFLKKFHDKYFYEISKIPKLKNERKIIKEKTPQYFISEIVLSSDKLMEEIAAKNYMKYFTKSKNFQAKKNNKNLYFKQRIVNFAKDFYVNLNFVQKNNKKIKKLAKCNFNKKISTSFIS